MVNNLKNTVVSASADQSAPAAPADAPADAPTTAEMILNAAGDLAAIPRPVKGEKQIEKLKESHQTLADLHTLAVHEATVALHAVASVSGRQSGEESLAIADKSRREALEAFYGDFPSERPTKKIQFNHGASSGVLSEMRLVASGFMGAGSTVAYAPSEREFLNAVWNVAKAARFTTADDGTVTDKLADAIVVEFDKRKKPKTTVPRVIVQGPDLSTPEKIAAEIARLMAMQAASSNGLTE